MKDIKTYVIVTWSALAHSHCSSKESLQNILSYNSQRLDETMKLPTYMRLTGL